MAQSQVRLARRLLQFQATMVRQGTGSLWVPTLEIHDLSFHLGASIGDCTTDTFSITSPGNIGSPVICGFNTGQHSQLLYVHCFSEFKLYNLFLVILDAADACNMAVFDLTGSDVTRAWDIKVTQYKCGDEMGGKQIYKK